MPTFSSHQMYFKSKTLKAVQITSSLIHIKSKRYIQRSTGRTYVTLLFSTLCDFVLATNTSIW